MPVAGAFGAAPSRRRSRPHWSALLPLAAVTAVVAYLATRRVRGVPYPLDLAGAWRGLATTASATVPAALTTWLVLAVTLAALARILRRRDTALEIPEAVAGALVLLWSGAYLALLALGPLGLYRPWVLRWALVGVVLLALARRGRPRPRGSARPGAWIAAVAVALTAPPLLMLQLASPVSPFMDILPYVASVQKIVTFRFYDPFGNDAAGLWAASRQVAGCDALYSLVALVAGIPASLAITSLIVPFAALQVLAVYRLGRTVHGSLAGGMAALFLVQTFVWRRTPDGRGTALAFILVALGLAFLFAPRRGGTRTALGGLALGLAVAVNPLIGAIGMQLAAAGAVVEAVDFGHGLVPRTMALAGGTLFALPQVSIGLARPAPIWALVLAAGAGACVLLLVARGTRDQRPARRAWPVARLLVIVALPIWVLWIHARRGSEFFNDEWFGYGILFLFAAAGLAALATAVWRQPRRWRAAALPALALALGVADWMLASPQRFAGPLEIRSLAGEITSKMVWYWSPYWLALAAGVWFGMLARRWARVPAVALALLVVVYPLRHVADLNDTDGTQLSLVETWGFHLTNAARGYFGGYPDRRWVLNDDWGVIVDVLRAEIDAGRITYQTHVLQVTPSTSSVAAALGLGVSVDLLTPHFDPNDIWTVGGRIRGMGTRGAAFAARPPYVLLEGFAPEQYPELAAYEELAAQPNPRLRLYRLRAAGAPAASSEPAPAPTPE